MAPSTLFSVVSLFASAGSSKAPFHKYLELGDSSDIVSTVALSTDSKFLASGSYDNKTRVYVLNGLHDPSQVYTLEETDTVNSVAFSGDSKLLVSASHDHKVRVYGLQDGSEPQLLHTLDDANSTVDSVAVSADSKFLASASCDRTVLVYALGEGSKPSLQYTLNDTTACANNVVFSPDSKFLATGSWDYKIRVYALEEGSKPSLKFSFGGEGMVGSVAFSPDSTLLAGGFDDNTVIYYNISSQQNYTLNDAYDAVSSVAFSDSNLASASWDNSVRVYQIYEKQEPWVLYSLEESTDWVSSIALSADSKLLASGSYDGKLRLYWLNPSAATEKVMV